MQVVIDIDENLYTRLFDNGVDNYDDAIDMAKAIRKGKPLPKGHGRLIDVNDLLNRIGLEDNDRNREDNVGEIVTLEDFDSTPIIIEAESKDQE